MDIKMRYIVKNNWDFSTFDEPNKLDVIPLYEHYKCSSIIFKNICRVYELDTESDEYKAIDNYLMNIKIELYKRYDKNNYSYHRRN